MKEATGELNMTVITVVAIAAVGAFFYAFVWPAIKGNITSSTRCANAVCTSCTTANGRRNCTGCSFDTNGDGTVAGTDETGFSCTYND